MIDEKTDKHPHQQLSNHSQASRKNLQNPAHIWQKFESIRNFPHIRALFPPLKNSHFPLAIAQLSDFPEKDLDYRLKPASGVTVCNTNPKEKPNSKGPRHYPKDSAGAFFNGLPIRGERLGR